MWFVLCRSRPDHFIITLLQNNVLISAFMRIFGVPMTDSGPQMKSLKGPYLASLSDISFPISTTMSGSMLVIPSCFKWLRYYRTRVS